MITPPTILPMTNIREITPRYTDAQLAGDEPIFETVVYGTNSMVVRVVADIVKGEVWPTLDVEGRGPLTLENMRHLQTAIGACTGEMLRFLVWKDGRHE